jgi:hypothetical protein
VSIPKVDISGITVSFGRSVERPFLRILGALLLCFIGLLVGFWPLFIALGEDTIREPGFTLKPFAYTAPLVLIGLWLIWEVFRKSPYLLIRTDYGERRLPLEGCTPDEVILPARRLDYPVDTGA